MDDFPGLVNCVCWVSFQPLDVQFCVRWGAHSVYCPIYRPSGDPVDRATD